MSILRTMENGKANTATHKNWIFTKQFIAEGCFDEQVKQSLSSAFLAAKQAGAVSNSIVKCDMVIRDAVDTTELVKIYQQVISNEIPAIKVQVIANLPQGIDFGVELTAVTAESGLKVERFSADKNGIPAAVRVGNYIYTSLQLPDEKGSFDFEAAQVVKKAVAAVEAAGGVAAQIVKNFALIIDINNFGLFNGVYAQTFRMENDPPARSLIGVSQIGDGYQTAMECIAYTGVQRESFSMGPLKGKMPFCSAMRGGDFLYVSGQIGVLNADGSFNVDLVPQTEHLFRVIDAVTSLAGCDASKYLKCNGFCIKPEYLKNMIGNYKCAEAIFPVPFLANAGILVEMDLVAAATE